MKNTQFVSIFSCLLLLLLAAACAPVKTLDVWQDESYTQPLQKVLVIALAERDNRRNQVENVLSNHLTKRGVEVILGHKVLPAVSAKPDKATVLAIVKELGVDNVLVARSISQKEITNHQYGGLILGGVAVYNEGWYGYSYGYTYNREFDTKFFTVSTKLYDVTRKQPVWSYISQVRVENSPQGGINLLVPEIVKQLEISQLITPLSH